MEIRIFFLFSENLHKCIYRAGCKSLNEVGDGFCDDYNNNHMCEYDGGDCCGSFVNQSNCTICLCLDPKYFENSIGNVGKMTLE